MLASVLYLQMLRILMSFQYVLSLTCIVTLITVEGFKYSLMINFYVSFHIIRPCKLFKTNVTFVSLDSQVNGFFMYFQAAIPCSLMITKITTKSYSFMHSPSVFSQSACIFCLIFARVTVVYFHFTVDACFVPIDFFCDARLIVANVTIK